MPTEEKADSLEGLADDATKADDIPEDTKERRDEQMAYYGGDIEDDEDLSALDRGDSIEVNIPEKKDEEEEEEQASEDEDGEAASEADDDAADDEADSEEGDDGGEEGDDDDGDDADDAESGDDGESEDSTQNDQRIPLSRFNEVNERMKAAERRLAQLEAQETAEEEGAEETFDFDAAEQEYMDLLLDGNTKDAAAKRKEIRAAEKAEYEAAAQRLTTDTVTQDATVRELNSLTNQAAEMYPVLNDQSADFNPAIAEKTVIFMRGYVEAGKDPSDAFVSALSDVIDMYNLDGATEQPSNEDTTPEKKVTKKKGVKKTQEKKKVREQQAQSPAGEGRRSADAGAVVPDLNNLTEEEFAALPESTLAKLRGDVI